MVGVCFVFVCWCLLGFVCCVVLGWFVVGLTVFVHLYRYYEVVVFVS